ncbi:hypothetical protein QUF64_08695 [Anaerolineales bacterium HSG6]|nr:hypothetical protein [Anaerolineales bacterium HSG6]
MAQSEDGDDLLTKSPFICSGQLDVEKDYVTLSVFCEGSHSPESREIRVDTSPSAQYDMVFNIILTTTKSPFI